MSRTSGDAAYGCDVTYCTNKELAFDYLKDRLRWAADRGDPGCSRAAGRGRIAGADRLVLRGLCFAIVDEADSVLIDEARTPLIISGAADKHREAECTAQALTWRRPEPAGTSSLREERRRSSSPTAGKTRRSSASGLGGLWRGRAAPRGAGPAGARRRSTLSALDRHYLVRDGKVADHRRVHGPDDARPLLGAGAAPADRGQGRLRGHGPRRRRWRASPTSGFSAAICTSPA